MNKYKRLFSDTLLFTLSNFASKILIFILMPLYTNILITSEYGIGDLITSTINLIYPILTLAISEATLRFALDKRVKKNEVLSISLLFIGISVCILLLVTPFIKYLDPKVSEYWVYFIVIYICYNINYCLAQYTRGCEKVKLFALQGVVQTFAVLCFNIFTLIVLKMGLRGYLISIILSYIVTITFITTSGKYYKEISKFRINTSLVKEMLKYSIPIVPSLVAWWVNNAADRYIIIAKIGISASGIYSASYKIPTILTMVTSIFIQAWQISAISNYGEADNSIFFTNIYKYFNVISVVSCSVLIILSQFLGKILFAKDYYIAWTYVPTLLIAFVFSGLSGFLATIFTSSKKTNILFISTLIGAITNILLNFISLDIFGIVGAAYTTAISFMIMWFIRYVMAKRIIAIKINLSKPILAYLLLIIQALIMTYQVQYMYEFAVAIFIIILCISSTEIKILLKMIIKLKKVKN